MIDEASAKRSSKRDLCLKTKTPAKAGGRGHLYIHRYRLKKTSSGLAFKGLSAPSLRILSVIPACKLMIFYAEELQKHSAWNSFLTG